VTVLSSQQVWNSIPDIRSTFLASSELYEDDKGSEG
jgi:hypothetical protein